MYSKRFMCNASTAKKIHNNILQFFFTFLTYKCAAIKQLVKEAFINTYIFIDITFTTEQQQWCFSLLFFKVYIVMLLFSILLSIMFILFMTPYI